MRTQQNESTLAEQLVVIAAVLAKQAGRVRN
ncbi:hypothetical protein TBK1r_47760 [Stieleria magnilauensis]|uniref:Uncharacterized protein n=1 Tax=Stieleria magnilauensis TaxID=2527963 RepID=A0ABX5XWE5_9BACT|nr:hypothetical protein TBK1r_47760 [Planctomycetes bacterium TBK1r]